MTRPSLRLLAVVAVTAALLTGVIVAPADAGHDDRFPSVIQLPNGFAPEGIAIDAKLAYIGSLLTGQIEVVDLKSGQTSEFAPSSGPGKIAVGMDVDRHDRLWVAGAAAASSPGVTAGYRVYDTDSGDLLLDVELPDPAFVNDVIVTRRAAWLTDSFRPSDRWCTGFRSAATAPAALPRPWPWAGTGSRAPDSTPTASWPPATGAN